MRIDALSVLLRQALKKVFIIKAKLFSVAIMCACLASAQNVEASSVRAQVGLGSSDANIYSRGNLDLFLSDGTFAPYIGVENGGTRHDREYCASCNGVINSEYEYNAAVLGLQIKPFENRRVDPYLVLGVLHGKVKYFAWAKDYRDSVVSLSRDQASYTAYRGGFGLHIVLRKAALEVEFNATNGVPAAYANVNNGTSTANVEMFNRSIIVNVAFGVRYYF